ncbi:sigma-70 family RNA polymerase sigma factor [Cellulosimicrobium cellulans]|uniref:sigma-70 family RNA polymerase sigma factor n=1 Tax=Cellulosimicrobium cellulans TaxID=1710 RepID=UPI0030173B4A
MTQAQERVWSEAFSDAELITAVREGDTSAYGVLYERHAAAARTVARQYVRSTADADDVVSDAFARTLSVLQGGGGPDVTFRAYLFTVVRRLSYDLVNGARRTQPTDDERTFETAFGPMASTEDPTLEGFERSTVTRAYQDLPERWRAVLWYTEVENLSPADIAPILGLTANGVSALAYRAREGLRQAYLQQHLTSVPAEECRAVNALLGSYVRGGLAKRETARVESHLDGCGECRALVLELGDVSHGMRAVIAPLVLGVGALGLVGTALPTFGGAAVAGGVGAALQGASSGGAGTAGGSGAAGGSGGAGAGAGAGGGAGAAGTSAAGTGVVGGAGAAAGAAGGAGGAVGAGAASVGGAAAAAGGAAAGSGALAAAGAGGLVALVASAPVAAAAVTVGVLAVAGLGVAGALGAFSPDPGPTPTSQSSPSPSGSPTPSPTSEATSAPTDPSADPTSPTNIPPAPTDSSTAGTGDTTGTGGGSPTDGTTPVGSTPGTTTPGGSTDPGAGTPTPTDPGTGTPGPTDPGTPEPAPAALELSLAPVSLAARVPADLVITASNSGGRAAEEVFVDLTLPAGVSTPGSSLVARGTVVGGPLSTASLPCGSAVPQSDGTSLVTCSVGVLAPRATQDLSVQVRADSGGEYAFAASLRAKGVEPSRRSFPPTKVSYWGAELRVTAEPTLAFDNPGDATLRLSLRNSGDEPAVEPRVTVDLPDGLSLVGGGPRGWSCEGGDGAVTCASPSGTTLAPHATVDVPVLLLADLETVPDDLPDLQVQATAGGARSGTASVDPAVDDYWGGAADGLRGDDGEPRGVVPQCTATEKGDVASLVATYTNTTAYDDLDVTVEAAGSSATRTVGVGQEAKIQVDDGVRYPAGRAAVVLSTNVAGERFEHRLDAGPFDALDCWTPPPWLTAADVHVAADNDGGTVRWTASVVNGTGEKLDVRLLAPDNGTWSGVADSAAITPLADRATGDLVLDTGLTHTVRGNAVLRQYRWHQDDDGDGKGYESLLPVLLEAQRIAPDVPGPSLGQCRFDPETDTSGAAASLVYDNSASTLPVVFSVDGRPGLSKTVPAGGTAEVELPRAGAQAATYAVRSDGREIGPRTVRAVDCFRWSVTGSATTRWSAESGSFVVEGTFRNTHAVTPMSVVLDAGRHGSTDAVKVAPGAEASFALDTGSRDVAAGSVTFRTSRVDAPGTEPHEVRASYDAARHAPSASRAPSVGECVFDAETDTSSAPVTVHYDNSASTVPVELSVAGRDDLTVTLKAGEVRDVVVPGGVGTTGASFEVRADGSTIARHDVAGVDCFEWNASGSATTRWSEETRSVVVQGEFRNGHAATALRVTLDGDELGLTKAVDVAPGERMTLTLDTGSRDVAAGEVVFHATRLDGSGRSHPVTASYDAVRHAPAVGSPVVGKCVLDPKTELSSAKVSLRYDNTRSTVPVVFSVAGRKDLTRTVDGGAAVTVDVPGGVGREPLRLAVLADGAPLASHDVAAVDCFVWKKVAHAADAETSWVVAPEAGVGTSVVTGTFRNPYAATTLRVGMSTPHGDAAPVEVAPGAEATFTVDAQVLSVPAGTATFSVERAAPSGPGREAVEARYRALAYSPEWARSATVDARWQDGSVKLVGTLTNDSPETIDVVMSAAGYGDSGPAQQVAPGATATFTVDTRALDVDPGSVTFRQSRTVLGTAFTDARLTERYQGDRYEPDWSAVPSVSAQCTAGTGGVVLTVGLRNDSAEAMHVVARTPFGDRDLGDVAPGASVRGDVAVGALAVKAGKVELELSRTVLGVSFTETLSEHFDAVDCTVEAPTASLVLGDPYYDAARGHSYRAVSVLLDNSGSNVPVTFRVTGQAKGEWTVAAGERRTESLGEAPWSGATYVVHAGRSTEQLRVDDFTAAPACYAEWEAGVWYDHDAEVSYRGWNYTARNISILVRPDRDPLGLFWERGSRCGEG